MNPISDHDNTINILFSQKKNSKTSTCLQHIIIVTVMQTFQMTNLSDGFLRQMKLPGSILLLNNPIERLNNIKRPPFHGTHMQITQINSLIFVHLKEIVCVCNEHYLSNCLQIRKQANIWIIAFPQSSRNAVRKSADREGNPSEPPCFQEAKTRQKLHWFTCILFPLWLRIKQVHGL